MYEAVVKNLNNFTAPETVFLSRTAYLRQNIIKMNRYSILASTSVTHSLSSSPNPLETTYYNQNKSVCYRIKQNIVSNHT